MITAEQITKEFIELSQRRGKFKEEKVKKLCGLFVEMCKERGLISFPREHITTLIQDVPDRSKRHYTQQILNHLLKNGIVHKDEVVKPITTFRNMQPLSFDYGSYNVLMNKNGYKRKLYKWVKYDDDTPPRRELVKTLNMGDIYDGVDFDFSIIESSMPEHKQRVTANTTKSYVKNIHFFSRKVVYTFVSS